MGGAGFFWYLTCSMYGIFTNIYHKFKPNVGKYSIHGAYGYEDSALVLSKLEGMIQSDKHIVFGWVETTNSSGFD